MNLFSNGQFDVKERRYVFNPNRGAYPGSFEVEYPKNPAGPNDLVLIYKSHEQDNPGIREFVLQLERGAEPGKPLVEPETGFIVKGGSNEEYYSAISKMRKMTGDLIID